MADTTYNGWSNRATWNVNLWLSNDQGLYNAVNGMAARHRTETHEGEYWDIAQFAGDLQSFCQDLWLKDGETPDGAKLVDCDFEEIAAAWVEN